MPAVPRLCLASGSPRRQQILSALGLQFTTLNVDIDERRLDGEAAADMVLRLAAGKARAAAVDTDCCVLGADTVVTVDDTVFGKPRDADDAVGMLMRLSGRTHRVLTGVALRTDRGLTTAMSSTDVRFRDIGRDEAQRYWQCGEPRGKAGAYAIQGIAGIFVTGLSGSYTGVMGLPVFETAELLRHAGIEVLGPVNPTVRDYD